MGTRWQSSDAPRGQDYDARWERLAASGVGVHGEADLIESLLSETGGSAVLDAGCGTGRVAIELAARGFAVVGLDADPAMLAAARSKAPDLHWIEADLLDTGAHLSEAFDLVALPGNVMIFLDAAPSRTSSASWRRACGPGVYWSPDSSCRPVG